MLRFNSSVGEVRIMFRHTLPSVEVKQGNDLIAIIQGLKVVKGGTECILEIGDLEFFGNTFLYPGDQYKKEDGRAGSLARALGAAADVMGLSDEVQHEILVGYTSRLANNGSAVYYIIAREQLQEAGRLPA